MLTYGELLIPGDGEHTLVEIAEKCNAAVWELYPILDQMVAQGLMEILPDSQD